MTKCMLTQYLGFHRAKHGHSILPGKGGIEANL